MRVRRATSAAEMEALAPVWRELTRTGEFTVFQSFEWNLLAARIFANRESPEVVLTESDAGVALVPACRRAAVAELGLLGEKLFDYRTVLHAGERHCVDAALAQLSDSAESLLAEYVRGTAELERLPVIDYQHYAGAPYLSAAGKDAVTYRQQHPRLQEQSERLRRGGFVTRRVTDFGPSFIRWLYSEKGREEHGGSGSLFADPHRVELMVVAARLPASRCELFVLEDGPKTAAVIVTFVDGAVRRFYTTWYDRQFSSLSPGVTLLFEAVCATLEEGLNFDFLTGEQHYKLRMADSVVPLYRARVDLCGALPRTPAGKMPAVRSSASRCEVA